MDINAVQDEVETCGYRDMYAFAYRRKLKCSLKNGLFFLSLKERARALLLLFLDCLTVFKSCHRQANHEQKNIQSGRGARCQGGTAHKTHHGERKNNDALGL